jgi:hypothetical protein
MPRNALTDLLDMCNQDEIVCADINIEDGWLSEKPLCSLPINHTPVQLLAFLAIMDFDYDAGFDGQELFGTVILTDYRWLERHEYDGSEWWELKEYTIPEICKPKESYD